MRYETEPDEALAPAALAWRVTHYAVSSHVVVALVTHAACATLLFLAERLLAHHWIASLRGVGSRKKKKMY